MRIETILLAHDPASLRNRRLIAHKAVQLLSKAARANLDPLADDSHSNMGWDAGGKRFLSQPIDRNGARWFVGVSLAPLALA